MFDLNLRQRNINEEELLNDLRNTATLLDQKTITKFQYAEQGNFGATTYLRRFGSWNKALEKAGLEIKCRINIGNDELFENLATVWKKLGKQPVYKDLDKAYGISKFSIGTYEKRFGSWNKTLQNFISYIQGNDFDNKKPSSSFIKNKPRTSRNINWRIRAKVLIRDNCICKMCGSSPSKNSSVELQVDHILPWSKGGETVLENLQTLCRICNVGKSDIIV